MTSLTVSEQALKEFTKAKLTFSAKKGEVVTNEEFLLKLIDNHSSSKKKKKSAENEVIEQ